MKKPTDEHLKHQDQILNAQSTLIEVLDEGVCIFERLPLRPDGLRDYRYVAMNKAMQSMFGIPNLSGQSIRDNFPDEVEDWYDDYDRVLETGQSVRFQRGSIPQGMVLEMYVTRLEDKSGKRLMAVMKDVTEGKQVATALLKSENRLTRAQSAAKIGTWEWDVLTNLSDWSDETFNLYGLNPAETTPSFENWLASVSPEDRATVTALVSDAVAKGAELDFQCRNLHNGHWLMYRGQPQFDA